MVDEERLTLFIDDKNFYHGARRAFYTDADAHYYGQIKPIELGKLICERCLPTHKRNLYQVRVYTGVPEATREPKTHSAHIKQRTAWEQAGVQVTRGLLIPREMEQHYIDNMGRNWETYQQEVNGLEDIQLTYKGLSTLASAGHHQFVTNRQLMLDILPAWDRNLMGKMIELENAVDLLGYLRLSTISPVTRLLGNVISPENAVEAQRLGLLVQAGTFTKPRLGLISRFVRLPLIKRLTLGLYNRLHILINS